MMKRRTRIFAIVFLSLFATVAAAQFFGIPRRVFSMIVSTNLIVEGETLAIDDNGLTLANNQPGIQWRDNNAAANEIRWLNFINQGEWRLRLYADNWITNTDVINIGRTASNPTTFDIKAGTRLRLDAALPELQLYDSDAPVDEKIWILGLGLNGQLVGSSRNDANASGSQWFQVDRTGTTMDNYNHTTTTLQHGGVDISADIGTFTLTLDTGCTTQPTGTATYSRIGNLVTLEFPTITCTSNSTAKTFTTDLPASIQPASIQHCVTRIQDNGVAAFGMSLMQTNGTIFLRSDANESLFTASGTAGVLTTTVSYLLN